MINETPLLPSDQKAAWTHIWWIWEWVSTRVIKLVEGTTAQKPLNCFLDAFNLDHHHGEYPTILFESADTLLFDSNFWDQFLSNLGKWICIDDDVEILMGLSGVLDKLTHLEELIILCQLAWDNYDWLIAATAQDTTWNEHRMKIVMEILLAVWLGMNSDAEAILSDTVLQETVMSAVYERLWMLYQSGKKLAYLLYTINIQRLLESIRNIRYRIQTMKSEKMPDAMNGYSWEKRDVLIKNIIFLELNQGCSLNCSFCWVSWGWKVKTPIPFDELLWIIRRQGGINYFLATDPYDYRDVSSEGEIMTYSDVLYYHKTIHGSYPFTSTAYPEKWVPVVRSTAHLVDRFSVSARNMKRYHRDKLFRGSPMGSLLPNSPWTRQSVFFWWRFTERTTLDQFHKSRPQHSSFYDFYSSPESLKYSWKQRLNDWDQEAIILGITVANWVIFKRDWLFNTVVLYSSKAFPDGKVDVKIAPDNLEDWYTQMQQSIQSLNRWEIVKLQKLLTLGIVKICYVDSKIHEIYNNNGEVQTATTTFEMNIFWTWDEKYSARVSYYLASWHVEKITITQENW